MIGLEYNTQRSPLIIPEYGRHIQKLAQDAVQIPNREHRNIAARGIVAVMANLHPEFKNEPEFQHKLWDLLFVMSDFQLDVDAPFPKPTRQSMERHPVVLPYPQNFPKYRFYGNNIQRMIEACARLEDSPKKTEIMFQIANHMKKSFLSWNKETVDDEVIFQHLYELSGGKLNLAQFQENLSASKHLPRNKYQKKNNNYQNYQRKNQNNNRKKRY